MSSRAHRLGTAAAAERFTWGGPTAPAVGALPSDDGLVPVAAPASVDPAAVERDAFAKGYAQGERAGAEASAARSEAMLRRFAQTLDELRGLRKEILRRTEREVVELALAIARRIVQREVSLDAELVVAMARVALDRLGEITTASIRLHPDDHAAALGTRGASTLASHGVAVVADPSVARGGCVVQSDAGAIDVGVAAQIDELTHVLLGDTWPASTATGRRDDAAA
jgi:flagellar assembly protein FliH